MFENLLNLVKENSGDGIIDNPAIPNEKNEDAIQTTTTSIFESLKGQFSSGNMSSIMDMFKGGGASATQSSAGNVVQTNVVSELMKKFGIDNSQATEIANKLVPKVMEKFVNKTNDPNDKSFDLPSIVNSLGGTTARGGIGSMIKGLFN